MSKAMPYRTMERPTGDIRPQSEDSVQKGFVFILGNRMSVEESITHENYVSMMDELWRTTIGCELFDGTTHMNINGRNAKTLFKRLAKIESNDFEYLVVVIIARGGLMESRNGLGDCKPRSRIKRVWKGLSNRAPTNRTYSPFFFGNDGKKVSEEKILSYFYNDSSSWKDKPKLFILAYNRISELTISGRQIVLTDQSSQPQPNQAEPNEGSSKEVTLRGTSDMRDPRISDFALIYGTSSYVIEAIDSAFSRDWQMKSVTELMTSVNDLMKNRVGRMSVFESSLVRPFSLLLKTDYEADTTDGPQPVVTSNVGRIVQELLKVPSDELRNFSPELQEVVERIVQPNRTATVKGCILILSNALEPGTDHHQIDSDNMKQLWKETLGCDLYLEQSHINKSAEEMSSLLLEFSSIDASRYDYAVVVISCHSGLKKSTVRRGRRRTLLRPRVSCPYFVGKDGKSVEERTIMSFFNRTDSPWHRKVKIFILDYCRGNLTDHGVPKAMPFRQEDLLEEQEMRFKTDESILPASISTMVEDSFLVYATHAKYSAYSNGLINCVKEVFTENWKTKSVAHMLTFVNGRMKASTRRCIAMSVFKSTMTKDFFLFPQPRN